MKNRRSKNRELAQGRKPKRTPVAQSVKTNIDDGHIPQLKENTMTMQDTTVNTEKDLATAFMENLTTDSGKKLDLKSFMENLTKDPDAMSAARGLIKNLITDPDTASGVKSFMENLTKDPNFVSNIKCTVTKLLIDPDAISKINSLTKELDIDLNKVITGFFSMTNKPTPTVNTDASPHKEKSTPNDTPVLSLDEAHARACRANVTSAPKNAIKETNGDFDKLIYSSDEKDSLAALAKAYAILDTMEPSHEEYTDAYVMIKLMEYIYRVKKGIIKENIVDRLLGSNPTIAEINEVFSTPYSKGNTMSNKESLFNNDVKNGLIAGGVAAAASLAIDYMFNPEKSGTSMAVSAAAVGAAGGVAGYTVSRYMGKDDDSMLKRAALTVGTGVLTAGVGKGISSMMSTTSAQKITEIDVPTDY